MIQVNCALLQEEIKSAVLAVDPGIKFIKKAGMGLLFETPDDIKFHTIVKKSLKSNPKFKAVYFNIDIK